jgi:hypothetical protein
MRIKLVLFSLTVVAVGTAYFVTHRHSYKNHPNAEAAADFAGEVCATNTIIHVINAYPGANRVTGPVTPADEARRERIFHYDVPGMAKPMADKLKGEATWDYLHDLGSRASDVSSKRAPSEDLKKELRLFSKEVAADVEALCPRDLPAAPQDAPYVPFAIVTIVEALGEVSDPGMPSSKAP